MPEHALAGGEEGTIVEILDQPERAYLVDFSGGSADAPSSNLPVVPVTAHQPSRPRTTVTSGTEQRVGP